MATSKGGATGGGAPAVESKCGHYPGCLSKTLIERREATARVDDLACQSLRQNEKYETAFLILLPTLFLTGVGLLIAGWANGNAASSITGAVFEVALAYPIAQLRSIRQQNIRLRMVPAIVELAGGNPAAEAELVEFMRTLRTGQ